MELDYEKELFASKGDIIVLRAARRTGKTLNLIRWVLESEGDACILAPYEGQIRKIKELISILSRNEIIRIDNDLIHFRDKRILLIDASNNINRYRGCRFKRVAFDNAGKIPVEWIDLISRVAGEENTGVLTTLSDVGAGTVGERLLRHPELIKYIEYNYLHALMDERMEEDFIQEWKQYSSEETFQKEFGPWKDFSLGTVSNQQALHLLHPSF